MATFVLIHGGGGGAWDWHLLTAELQSRGHQVVAVDLPSEDESGGAVGVRGHSRGRGGRAHGSCRRGSLARWFYGAAGV